MYVIWRSGLQPRWLLHITHILFRCAAMDGGTPGLWVLFWKDCFLRTKKAPDVLSLTEDFSFGESPWFGSLRQRLRSFLRKLRSLRGFFTKTNQTANLYILLSFLDIEYTAKILKMFCHPCHIKLHP